MRVHTVVHESFEGPGAIEDWARTRGHALTRTRLHEGDALPASASGIDLLVVMGGPQRTTTTTEECRHFDAAAEKALIAACVTAGAAVVGVCLGAQLLGEALGAPAEPSPYREAGAFPVTLTAQGRRHPFLAGFGDTFTAGHWHSDMPGLTPGAAVLAASAGCPRQIVAYGDRVYGFQCHLEFTPDLVRALLARTNDEASRPEGPFDRPDGLRNLDLPAMNHRLTSFLDRLAGV
ncbi:MULTISPECIES: glutamine amidotransferase-related protein [unclassified Streptomyces]|uniref:glutamine amidotransferase-related protein n=1 Tax=unclassified Streptomyces TaxID=2593676 RepID=UPI000F7023A8|nr:MULTISPECIES: glutamine amidotransferase [unclassified Streptomyces]AZM62273.1 glutamine amidotransferase [Streptomyces sp. WAC 01438]RSM96292.1 glutamine amidotransferase [Streptomyces sp. WAC 01420]